MNGLDGSDLCLLISLLIKMIFISVICLKYLTRQNNYRLLALFVLLQSSVGVHFISILLKSSVELHLMFILLNQVLIYLKCMLTLNLKV